MSRKTVRTDIFLIIPPHNLRQESANWPGNQIWPTHLLLHMRRGARGRADSFAYGLRLLWKYNGSNRVGDRRAQQYLSVPS